MNQWIMIPLAACNRIPKRRWNSGSIISVTFILLVGTFATHIVAFSSTYVLYPLPTLHPSCRRLPFTLSTSTTGSNRPSSHETKSFVFSLHPLHLHTRTIQDKDTATSLSTAANNPKTDWRDIIDHIKHHVQRSITSGLLGLSVMTVSMMLLLYPWTSFAENELSDRYGNRGLDTSLVDQSCVVQHCSLQAQACLQKDPTCRKGLTCTAKCLGDNACITGCMARYGNVQLDQLLQCTIEDHECIKVAILPGGNDAYGKEPKAPAPTISNLDVASMEGTWYKVIGYNPNYDCYACQRNTFHRDTNTNHGPDNNYNPILQWGSSIHSRSPPVQLQMDVEFSMPHLLPDGSPVLQLGKPESVLWEPNQEIVDSFQTSDGFQSIALNDYHTHEIMIFDNVVVQEEKTRVDKRTTTSIPGQLVINPGTSQEKSYARTAHSQGEMFGLKFWENWYVIGENDKGSPEFKFIYYNGKTRQNTYEGAFVYSRTKELAPETLQKVYQIAKDAGMNPDHFCRIRNGCFTETVPSSSSSTGWESTISDPFRTMLASTRISQLLGVEPVAAQAIVRRDAPTAKELTPQPIVIPQRPWWYEIGDYLENPHRHFQVLDRLRLPMDWPNEIVTTSNEQ